MPCLASHHSGQGPQLIPKMSLNFSGSLCLACTLFTTFSPGLFPPCSVAREHHEPWLSHSAVALWPRPNNCLLKWLLMKPSSDMAGASFCLVEGGTVRVTHSDIFAVYSIHGLSCQSGLPSSSATRLAVCWWRHCCLPVIQGEPSRLLYSFLYTMLHLSSFSLLFSLRVSSLAIPRDSPPSLSSPNCCASAVSTPDPREVTLCSWSLLSLICDIIPFFKPGRMSLKVFSIWGGDWLWGKVRQCPGRP